MIIRRRMESESEEKVEINLSPMIDCIFILLIFFIVTTVFVEETGIQVQKPEAASSRAVEEKPILIAISADDRVFYGGREIGITGIRPTLTRVFSQEDDLPVVIQADRNATHGTFSKVYGEARAAGARIVHFSTREDR